MNGCNEPISLKREAQVFEGHLVETGKGTSICGWLIMDILTTLKKIEGEDSSMLQRLQTADNHNVIDLDIQDALGTVLYENIVDHKGGFKKRILEVFKDVIKPRGDEDGCKVDPAFYAAQFSRYVPAGHTVEVDSHSGMPTVVPPAGYTPPGL